MGRVCYGPSLSWAEFAMGRVVQLPTTVVRIASAEIERRFIDNSLPVKLHFFLTYFFPIFVDIPAIFDVFNHKDMKIALMLINTLPHCCFYRHWLSARRSCR